MATEELVIQNAKTILSIGDNSIDNLLLTLLKEVEKAMEAFYGIHWGVDTFREEITIKNGIGVLSHKPVVEIIEIAPLYTSPLQIGDIEMDSDKGIIKLPPSFKKLRVLVEYKAGIDLQNIPPDLVSMLTKALVRNYANLDTVKAGVERLSTPDGTITYSSPEILPQDVREMLKRKYLPLVV